MIKRSAQPSECLEWMIKSEKKMSSSILPTNKLQVKIPNEPQFLIIGLFFLFQELENMSTAEIDQRFLIHTISNTLLV